MEYSLQLLSVVDCCTNWCEFAMLLSMTSKYVAEIFDKIWLCRYPRPLIVGHDNGTEFMGAEFQEIFR